MNSDTLISLAAVGVGGYFLWKYFGSGGSWNATTAAAALSNAGASVTTGGVYNDPEALFATTNSNTTYKFNPGDTQQLNFAQRFLISLDKIVPGTWLTDAVLQ